MSDDSLFRKLRAWHPPAPTEGSRARARSRVLAALRRGPSEVLPTDAWRWRWLTLEAGATFAAVVLLAWQLRPFPPITAEGGASATPAGGLPLALALHFPEPGLSRGLCLELPVGASPHEGGAVFPIFASSGEGDRFSFSLGPF